MWRSRYCTLRSNGTPAPGPPRTRFCTFRLRVPSHFPTTTWKAKARGWFALLVFLRPSVPRTRTETSGGARYHPGRFVKGSLGPGNRSSAPAQQNRGWEAATEPAEGGEGPQGSAVVSGMRATTLTRADRREDVWGRDVWARLGPEERNKQGPEVPRSRAFWETESGPVSAAELGPEDTEPMWPRKERFKCLT